MVLVVIKNVASVVVNAESHAKNVVHNRMRGFAKDHGKDFTYV